MKKPERVKKPKTAALFSASVLFPAAFHAFIKLLPHVQFRNPVMFVTYVLSCLATAHVLWDYSRGIASSFEIQITLWLWITVWFANFAEALAEGRGKAHAQTLRKKQSQVYAILIKEGIETRVLSSHLKRGDVVICTAGDLIPADGEVVEGIATVDESAITGESAPVVRESGGDRSAVTSGTTVLSDHLVIRVTSEPGSSFLDRMIGMIEGAKRQKTPNEIALSTVLSAITFILLVNVGALRIYADYSAAAAGQDIRELINVPILAALIVCLIPTTIGGLLSAVGIAGMDRLLRHNVVAKSGRAVEAAGDIDLLLLDKTGTITLGNRIATEFVPAPDYSEQDLATRSQLASLADETPEGRSIVILAKGKYNLRGGELRRTNYKFHPFSAETRMSGVDVVDEHGRVAQSIRKGAVDAITAYVESQNGTFPKELRSIVDQVSRQGSTPLLVSEGNRIIGLIHLKDVVKGGIHERFAELRKMGIRTVMVTGDNPLTAAAIAAEAGVDDFIAEATPEMKFARIKEEQRDGRLVAMTGDGTNDAPALALADVAVAMNTGTQASREAGNMVDLDSNPTKLIEIVLIGKQLLMTRGALTSFSLANDIAKYFAILPAMFGTLYANGGHEGPLSVMNIMHLHSPYSAILSSVIFNALVLLFLIPLAIRGVYYRSESANVLLLRNVLTYGLGGLIVPFVGIKLVDLFITTIGLVA